MTWKSHTLLGFSLSFALGLGYVDCAAAAVTSTLPDRIETAGPLRILKHRGLSHEILFWLVLFLALLPLPGIRIMGNAAFHPFSLCLGPLAHLFADSLTPGGIRFLGIRTAFPMVKTSSTDEYLLSGFLAASWMGLGYLMERLPLFLVAGPHVFPVSHAWITPIVLMLPVAAARLFLPLARLRSPKRNGIKQRSSRTLLSKGKTVRFEDIAHNWLEKPKEDKKTSREDRQEEKKEPVKTQQAVQFLAKGKEAELLNGAWGRLVEPYTEILSRNDLLPYVIRIFEILDQEGSVPSVRTRDKRDRQRDDNQFEALSGVSLAAHTVHVANHSLDMTLERYPEGYSSILPRIFVAALAHDLGKLPSVSGQKYVTGQHPLDGAAYLLEIMKGHPWAERIADLVRRHHEAVVERTPVELAILIRADREARAAELKTSLKGRDGGTVKTPAIVTPVREKSFTGPPETREIPPDYPLETVLEKLRDVTNVMLTNGAWVAFSQPDGLVYVQAETLHQIISEVAGNAGFDDPFFHSTERPVKKSCLQSFYDEFRKRGFVPEKLVSKGFYGNFFWVWNPKGRRLIRTFYMPVKAQALRMDPAELEARRNEHAILAAVKIRGVAPNKDTPPEEGG